MEIVTERLLADGRGRRFQILVVRERSKGELNITPRNVCRKFTRKQLRVGTRDVDIRVLAHPNRIDDFFPTLNIVNLVKEEISLALFVLLQSALKFGIKNAFLKITGVFLIIQVEIKRRCARIDLVYDQIPNLPHQDRLAATPHTRENFNDIRADKSTHLFQQFLP